MFKVMIY